MAPVTATSKISTKPRFQRKTQRNTLQLGREITFIKRLTPRDVLLGRGTGPNDHPGNIQFRANIHKSLRKYDAEKTREGREAVVLTVIGKVRASHGRFVRRLTKKEMQLIAPPSGWSSSYERYPLHIFIDDDTLVLEKTKQCFRHNIRKKPNFAKNGGGSSNEVNDEVEDDERTETESEGETVPHVLAIESELNIEDTRTFVTKRVPLRDEDIEDFSSTPLPEQDTTATKRSASIAAEDKDAPAVEREDSHPDQAGSGNGLSFPAQETARRDSPLASQPRLVETASASSASGANLQQNHLPQGYLGLSSLADIAVATAGPAANSIAFLPPQQRNAINPIFDHYYPNPAVPQQQPILFHRQHPDLFRIAQPVSFSSTYFPPILAMPLLMQQPLQQRPHFPPVVTPAAPQLPHQFSWYNSIHTNNHNHNNSYSNNNINDNHHQLSILTAQSKKQRMIAKAVQLLQAAESCSE